MPSFWRLTVYESDDATQWFQVSTDPAHAQPFLFAPQQHSESEVDLVKGSSRIGQVTVRVLDRRTNPADQKTGYITARLANAGGDTALNGRRAHLEENPGTGYVTVMDGVVGGVSLDDNMVVYTLPVRDIRERERKTKAFTSAAIRTGTAITQAPVVVPRGILAGYGRRTGLGANIAPWLVPPVKPITGTFRANIGAVEVARRSGAVPDYPVWEQQRTVLAGLEPERYTLGAVRTNLDMAPAQAFKQDEPHPNVAVLWRPVGGTTWTEIKVRHYDPVLTRAATITDPKTKETKDGRIATHVAIVPATGNKGTMPADAQTVEVCVVYIGPPTASYPLAIEGTTFGGLLRDLYDGRYSEAAPRIRYDAAAVASLNTPVRALIEKSAEDMREWTEKHIYQPLGAAPALSENGTISPIRYALPEPTETLVTINDTNAAPDAAWEHSAGDAVNIVRVEYHRDYGSVEATDPFGERANGIGIRTQPVIVEHRDQASIALLGEQDLEMRPATLRAVAGWMIGTLSFLPELQDEIGHQLADARKRQIVNRFRFGGQHFRVKVRRSVSEGWTVGQWALVQLSQFPDYVSGIRGSNRLAQIVSAKTLNGAWREFRLQDAGPGAVQPLAVPTIGTLSATADGALLIPITAYPAGAGVRVEYAISDMQPVVDSGLWTHAQYWAAGAGTVQTFPLPSGVTVWARARSEQAGRRPSFWVVPGSVVIPRRARVAGVRAFVQVDGTAWVEWTANSGAAGVRIRYAVHAENATPVLGNAFDRNAADGLATIPVTVPAGYVLTVEVVPWTGWDGVAVFGTAGDAVTDDARRGDVETPGVTLNDFRYTDSDPRDERTYVWNPGARVARVSAAHLVVPGDVTDANWLTVRDNTALLPSGATSYTVPQPRFGQSVIGQIEPRDASMNPGAVRRFTINGVRPSAEQDSIEGDTVATLWWKTRYNVAITAFVIFTKCGTEPEVDRAPTRFPGGTSKVKGGTLGADECELDVTLHQTRITQYRVEAHIDTGAVVVLCEGAFDRNRMPDLVAVRVQDGGTTQTVEVIGDADVGSIQIDPRQFKDEIVTTGQSRVGQSATFTLSIPANTTPRTVTVIAYTKPDPNGGTYSVEYPVTVRGPSPVAVPRWDAVKIAAPAVGSSTWSYSLDPDSDLTGYEVDVRESYNEGHGWSNWQLERTHSAAAANLPGTTEQTYPASAGNNSWTRAAGSFVRTSNGPRTVAYRVWAQIRRASDNAIVENAVAEAVWFF